MKKIIKKIIKKILVALGLKNSFLYWVLSNLTYLRKILKDLQGLYSRECPCCGFHGKFIAFGHPPRYDAKCPQCGSLERHRLLFIIDRKYGISMEFNLFSILLLSQS